MRLSSPIRPVRVVLSAAVVVAGALVAAPAAASAAAGRAAAVPQGIVQDNGYWLLGEDGGVFSFDAGFFGSGASDPHACPPNTDDREEPFGTCFSMASTPDGGGYWILNGDTGKILAFGNAALFGDPSTTFANAPREFVPGFGAIASTPTGNGYWVLEEGLSGLGAVEAFGDAQDFGDELTNASPHEGSPVAFMPKADGTGYWIVDFDGGVFSFGSAGFFGSLGAVALNEPIIAAAPTPSGLGYYLVALDGGVFTFGDAVFAGSLADTPLNAPVIGIAIDPVSGGYWLLGADGGVFSFGGAPFRGSLGATPLNSPVIAIAAAGVVS